MENQSQKKTADKVFEKKEKSEKEETKDQDKESARLAERKGQRPAFPFNRKKLYFFSIIGVLRLQSFSKPFPEMHVTDSSVFVDQIQRRPVKVFIYKPAINEIRYPALPGI